jgi:hypothetical protein
MTNKEIIHNLVSALEAVNELKPSEISELMTDMENEYKLSQLPEYFATQPYEIRLAYLTLIEIRKQKKF